jgi:UDP-N-acetylmuramoylalanine--D-glutamate ligase
MQELLRSERLARLAGQTVGVVGLGREGLDLVQLLVRAGARVTVSDSASEASLRSALSGIPSQSVRLLAGEQRGSDLLECSEIFVSPGVPRSVPVVADAAAAGIPLSSATRLFLELCPGPILGITGSSGKTTTTTLTGEMLREAGRSVFVGGNMGTPTLAHLDHISADTWSVLELSSFQLEDVTQSPEIGAVLNITPNHLDRHADMGEYIQAKGNLIRFQTDNATAILNADDGIVRRLPHASRTAAFSLLGQVNGTWLDGTTLWVGGSFYPARSNREQQLPPTVLLDQSEIPLRGLHNVANVLAASAAAICAGCDPAAIARAIRAFRPVTHRLEVVGTIAGATYVNDSIATSPERSIAGLNAYEEPIILIAGGRDKHLPMDDWARLIQQRARGVVLVGEAAPLIREALRRAGDHVPVLEAASFDDVVPLAQELAHPGDVVLLSPGCTSFDAFRDYEARGEAFRAAVRRRAEEVEQ